MSTLPNPPVRAPEWPPAGRSRALRWLRPACLVMAVAHGGCASGVAKTPSSTRAEAAPSLARLAPPTLRPGPAVDAEYDGPSGVAAADLESLPDAEPVVEPIRQGGPNRPYSLRGRSYVPLTEDRAFREAGLASWYGKKFHGRRTASGELYDMHAMTAAHPTLPLPSYVRVVNPANGREVVVRVNDRGPFHRGRIIDLSYAAAHKLGVTRGLARVEVERLTFDDIRTGAWRRTPLPEAPAAPDALLLAQAPQAGPVPPAVGTDVAPTASSALPLVTALAPTAAPLTAAATPPPAPMLAADVPLAPGPTATDTATTAAVPSGMVTLVAAREASTPPPVNEGLAQPAPGFWVQLGAFRWRDGAEGFHRKVLAEAQWLTPVLGVLSESDLHRLLAGPYRSQDEAHGVAQRVREALSLVPLVVERR